MMAMLKAMVGVGLLAMVGCSSAETSENPDAVSSALDGGADADAAPPPVECNGTNFRHLCVYAAVQGSNYGFDVKCTGTPFLPTDADGGVAFRAGGQTGCTTIGAVSLTGTPVARCCP